MLSQSRSFLVSVLLLTVAIMAATTGTAHAYIDAGTGSLILQVVLAGFFGSVFALKMFWGRVTGALSRIIDKFRTPETP